MNRALFAAVLAVGMATPAPAAKDDPRKTLEKYSSMPEPKRTEIAGPARSGRAVIG